MFSPLLAITWSDLLAAGLVLAFMVLVLQALRVSLEPRPRRSAAAPKNSPTTPRDATSRLNRARLDRIEARLARLEQRLRDGTHRVGGADDEVDEGLAAASPPVDRAGAALADTVLTLADAGASPLEIAQRLGVPAGRIELILNLHRAAPVSDPPVG